MSFTRALRCVFGQDIPRGRASILPAYFRICVSFFRGSLFPRCVVGGLLPQCRRCVVSPTIVRVKRASFAQGRDNLCHPTPFMDLCIRLHSVCRCLKVIRHTSGRLLFVFYSEGRYFARRLRFPFVVNGSKEVTRQQQQIRGSFHSVQRFSEDDRSQVYPSFRRVCLFFVLIPVGSEPQCRRESRWGNNHPLRPSGWCLVPVSLFLFRLAVCVLRNLLCVRPK